MINTEASKMSTAGYGQYLAYRKSIPVDINNTHAEAVTVQFGIGSTASIGSITVDTPVGIVKFHIVEADTPFLLCLMDMNNLQVYYNNITNTLVTPSVTLPITRRFGHLFLIWGDALKVYIQNSFNHNPCYLTNVEIRRLHRRFEHPLSTKLYSVLEQSGHNVDKRALDHLTKFCSFCQKYGRSPGRFKFTLRKDLDFNYSIFVDIMYINGSPVLHVINKATHYQAAHWLQSISAKCT